ncbi:MAG TPA: glycosyltransferase family 2 protein [Pyrinomonadaceae bacterium]|jgi:glycosyltransferase involved in cell wall biosynthesis|nr:glycosyltransferase family 2 protein [Pyrinomonadaceae bacterium]
MIDEITPLILTYNEAANIGRALSHLRWARDIVVVDSFSDDDTLRIARAFPQVRIFQRKFDLHAAQWNYGLTQTGIETDWVMALDADFIISDALLAQIKAITLDDDTIAFRAPFIFCIGGQPVRCAICPPATFLFKRDCGEYFQDGHTQKLQLRYGSIQSLKAPIFHDDRKPIERWLLSQQRYAQLEAQKLRTTPWRRQDAADRLRRLRIVAPIAMGLYGLLVRRALFDGWPGIFYVCQRVIAELLLSLNLLSFDLPEHQSVTARMASLLSFIDARVPAAREQVAE